jgi:DNA-binding beta-propeller fold protein YncE
MAVRRALIVATGRYRDAKFRELRAPAADAERLAGVLRNPAIGDFEVDVALDEDESPLRRRIARFYASSGRDDVLLLHISGHGVKDAHGGLYLAASDTELDLLDATALSAVWLDEQISRSRSHHKLLLLDCCFSGRFPFNATARAGESVDVQERFQGRGRAVITASTAMEYAYEGDQLSGEGQPSYFTAALVEGLETGEADRDQDQWISVDELYDYVYDRVKDVSPNQTPTKQIALEGPLYVARSSFKQAVEPARLDEQLLLLTEHPLPAARVGAVDELQRLLASSNAGVVRSARQALESMVHDDSRRVAELAMRALADHAKEEDQREQAAREATAKEQAEREQQQRAPSIQSDPKLKGNARVGGSLRIVGISFAGSSPIRIGRQWQQRTADGRQIDVAGATDTTLRLSDEHVDGAMRARITATNPHGSVTVDTPWSATIEISRPNRRRTYLITSATCVVIAAIIVVLLSSGSTGGGVGPNPAAIAVGQGHVWIANDTAHGIVTHIDAGSGEVVGSPIKVGRFPHAIAVGQGGVWVANNTANGTVTRIDAGSGKLVGNPISVGRSPTGIAVGQGSVWVANNGDTTVTRIDAGSGKVVGAPIDLGQAAYPEAVAVGEGSVWVSNPENATVTRIDAGSGRITGTPISLQSTPDAIAAGAGSVLVTDYARGTVTRIDAGSGKVVGTPISLGDYAFPNAIAVGQGSVWVANQGDGTVTRIDAGSGKVVGTPISLGRAFPNAITVGHGSVWVAAVASLGVGRTTASHTDANNRPNTVIRIDGGSGKVTARIS